MPRKSTKAANAANAKTASLTNTDGQPARGSQATRGAKRRRTSNNVNSASSVIYGTGTIVATNPFDDDHQIPTHHIQHLPPPQLHLQHHQHQPGPPMPNSNTQMQIKMMPAPSQMHHLQHSHQQQNQHHFQQHSTQMHHQHQPYPPPHLSQHQHPQQQQQQPLPPPPQSLPPNHHPHHQMYSPPNHHLQHMQVPPASHMSATPPGASMPEHLGGEGPPPIQQTMPHPQMLPHQTHQGFGPQAHATQMIGTSTPPHMMGPAPSHSPYMNHPQHGGPMMAPPHQNMTPQPPSQVPTPQQQPHLEQMLMQQQPYVTTANQGGGIFCGKCQREILQHEQNIICKAGCRACFHISCSGLTPLACDLLMKESLAEWACDRCRQRVPPIKYKS